jgi:hypothetical protein
MKQTLKNARATEQKAKTQCLTLLEFFRRSPLRGLELKIQRDKSRGRKSPMFGKK